MLSRLADYVRSRPLLRRAAHAAVRLIPDRPRTIHVPDLGPLRIRMRRHRHLLWEQFGQGDALALGMLQRLIRPGDMVYDIGANIGIYTRVMVQWFGAGRVVAFEPMRENFELLIANIALGDLRDRAAALQAALSDIEGEEDLQVDDMTSGTAVLSSVSDGEASEGRQSFGLPPLSERVRVMTLDGFAERPALSPSPPLEAPPPPDVMKIDTEGAEVKVLTGGRATLERFKPRLAIALHGDDKAQGTLKLLDELEYFSFGYVGGATVAASVKPSWRQIHAADAASLANNNILASCVLDDVRDEIVPYNHRQK